MQSASLNSTKRYAKIFKLRRGWFKLTVGFNIVNGHTIRLKDGFNIVNKGCPGESVDRTNSGYIKRY